MSKIEDIAQAISASFREEGAFWDGKWESEAEHQEFIKAARVAVAAMREPSDKMLRAAGTASNNNLMLCPTIGWKCAEIIYKAMIGAAN